MDKKPLNFAEFEAMVRAVPIDPPLDGGELFKLFLLYCASWIKANG